MAKAARRSVALYPSSPTLPNERQRPSTTVSPPTTPDQTKRYYHSVRQSTLQYERINIASRPYSAAQYQHANAYNATHQFESNKTLDDNLAAERERIRMEFYATYDVMTGVRIAATLGGFFGLMVFLVIYKSRSKSNQALKVLKDPKIAAAAAAVVQEEEDRELQEAIEATALSIFNEENDYELFKRQRLLSLGNVSAPPVLHRGFRFSSVGSGGYSSLLEPPRRYSYSGSRRKSVSVSESSRILTSAYPVGGSFGVDDFFAETDGDEADDEFEQITTTADTFYPNNYLSVPFRGQESRRSSDITCCSTESSFLERRCSAITLGLTSLPSVSRNPSRRPSRDVWDTFHPDIQVIQPTPKTSPCPSEGSIYEKTLSNYDRSKQTDQSTYDNITDYSEEKRYEILRNKLEESNTENTFATRRAPLASLSSFKISSADYQDSDLRSLGSDSVFVESYADTDEDMEQFSTDSDEISDLQSPPHTKLIASTNSDYHTICAANLDTKFKNCFSNNSAVDRSISNSISLSNTFETRAIIERQSHKQPQHNSYKTDKHKDSSSNFSSTSSKTNKILSDSHKNKSSECIEVSVIDNRQHVISPTVILELPVIMTQDDPPMDPSIPGPSRKWSKETLF